MYNESTPTTDTVVGRVGMIYADVEAGMLVFTVQMLPKIEHHAQHNLAGDTPQTTIDFTEIGCSVS